MALTILAALCLSGCGDRTKAVSAPPGSAPPGAGQGPASEGPVNPDPGLTRYVCADGQTITAGYPDRETAIVTYRDHSYTLKLGRSADGARYAGYGLQWWTRGGQANLAELKAGEEAASGPGLACRSATSAGDSMTRAGFTPAR